MHCGMEGRIVTTNELAKVIDSCLSVRTLHSCLSRNKKMSLGFVSTCNYYIKHFD